MISTLFIKRPIATSLFALALAIAGVVAFIILPVSSLPNIDFPAIVVNANLPGASPQIMASSVATPLERELGHISGVTEITSTSTLGSTSIVIQFNLSRNIDGAARDVQAAINAARSNLPANLPNNPTYRKANPADAPILLLALTSNINTRGQMYDLASSVIAQKISQVRGVGQVIVGGSSLPAVRIEVNPLQLNNANLSLNAVSQTIASATANQAKGELKIDDHQSSLIVNDQLSKAAQYRPLIIHYQNGHALTLSDVATVTDDVENIRTAGYANGKPAVILIIFKEPGANVVNTVNQIYKKIPEYKALLPGTVKMHTVVDRTLSIRASLHDVELTLLASIFLVILVVYAFLGNIRSMFIPGVAVILSLLGTFAFMHFFKFNLDNLSLMALTISTGFVIDDAIVVMENITRLIETGLKPFEAAIQGTKEVFFTVIAMSLSLIAIFIPLILMGGIVGRLFREFAFTLSIAILVSLAVSLTITPTMCAYFFDAKKTIKINLNRYQQFFERCRQHYALSLKWALQHQRLMLFTTLGAIFFNIALFVVIPKGFFPDQDTGRLIGAVVGDQNISFQAMNRKLIHMMRIVQQDPNVLGVAGFVGNKATNQGTLYINLKPNRALSSEQVIVSLRQKLGIIKGASLYLKTAQDLTIGGKAGNAEYQYSLSGTSLHEVNTWAPRILEKMKAISGISDVNSDQQSNGLQSYVDVNHDTALQLGVTSQAVDQALYDAFGQNQISTIYSSLNQYHVVLEAAPQYWQDPAILNLIYVPSTSGKLIPLSAFAHFVLGATLLAVNHEGLFPSATLSFNLVPGASLGDAVNKINDIVSQMHLPSTLYASFQGTAEAFRASLASEPYLIIAALLSVYIVLGILYESWIHPVTILSTLPSAGIGALLALICTNTELSLVAFIGVILLIGIVKKNAIMMIDVALTLQRTENLNPEEAIYRAALLRFRPIMMTTAAAMLGALPLAFSFGVGFELRQPLGIAIIGGLVVSQMLTIFTTPVVYLYLAQKRGQKPSHELSDKLD
ncbi:MAG: efflux RND transporter permease subunit [Gammaproteobacteria bacterium]|nr:efflux RND transporter permease subunit [Gammaproteobacteria bacterium]